jgi:2-phosphosulfolactate phosphatase
MAERALDVLLTLEEPARAAERMRDTVALLVDILRATTTLTTAFANGLRSATPVLTPDEAFSLRRANPEFLLGGERGGLRVPGFDFGNSPTEFTPERVRDRELLFTTTNGTRLMGATTSARRAVLGCFANLDAACRRLDGEDANVLIACAGNNRAFTIEDALFAGACVERLEGRFDLSDAAVACRVLWDASRERLVEAMASGAHGRRLVALGLGEDIVFCARRNTTTVVPELRDGVLCADFDCR